MYVKYYKSLKFTIQKYIYNWSKYIYWSKLGYRAKLTPARIY